MGAGLHPDARLELAISDIVSPYRDRVVEMEACDADVTGGSDGPALPAVGKKRPGTLAGDQRRIGLGEYQAAPERRCYRSNQQSVIAPGEAASDGPAGIGCQSIRNPPFAPLRLRKVATDCP